MREPPPVSPFRASQGRKSPSKKILQGIPKASFRASQGRKSPSKKVLQGIPKASKEVPPRRSSKKVLQGIPKASREVPSRRFPFEKGINFLRKVFQGGSKDSMKVLSRFCFSKMATKALPRRLGFSKLCRKALPLRSC